jgi:ribonuclease HII
VVQINKINKIVCGIDEAGRGPIIGPMVMAGVLIREEDTTKLEKIGVKDSKLLTKEQREDLFGKIKEIALNFKIEIVGPSMVDTALMGASSNLNWLEADTSAKIVNALKPDKVIVDCPSRNVSSYNNYFADKLNDELNKVEVVMEHKADLNYVVVGAASILAKVVRDREIEKLKKKFKVEFGSGYLSDEKTQVFLKGNFDNTLYKEFFRKSWQPYRDLVKWKDQKTLTNF